MTSERVLLQACMQCNLNAEIDVERASAHSPRAMFPRKRRNNGSKGKQSRHSINLLDLPLPALASIYQHCEDDDECRSVLLRVSTGCRDWVLSEARWMVLTPRNTVTAAARKPLARLLHRACSQSACPTLCFNFMHLMAQSSNNRLLADLLKPGIQQSGWTSVAKLFLQGILGTRTPAKLVSAAFPALQHLTLSQVSLNWRDLYALASCSHLSFLWVERCALPAAAPATNPLTALASLQQLYVLGTNSSIAQGLTQLTSLCLYSDTNTLDHLIMRCLDGMQQLQQLQLPGSDNEVPAAVVAQLFAAVPQLEGLELRNTIRQQAFDALLAHATQLTHFTCQVLDLSEDRSQSACSWKELVTGDCSIPQVLAHLPLHSLSRVRLSWPWEAFEVPSACPSLVCRLPSCTPAEIQAALTNLRACPAWQASGPSVHVRVNSQGQDQAVEQWLSALAALANKEVQLSVMAPEVQMTREVVQCLGATFGRSLTRLTLLICSIPHDFWPAVWRHLPGLQELRLWNGAVGAVTCADIAAFCSHATRPLSLRLGRGLYAQIAPAEQLEQQCRTWGAAQVAVTVMEEFNV